LLTRRGFLAATGLLAACARARPTGRDPQTLVLAVRADTTGIFPNPPIVNEAFTTQVNWNVFEGLVRLDRDLYLRPALAESWTTAPDEAAYTFVLKKQLRYSDGRPVTAQDVVTSLLRGREGVYRDSLHSIETARALSDVTVEIRLREAYVALLSRLPWGLVLPDDAWRRSPVPAVATGAYSIAEWRKGERLWLAANPHYRDAPVAFPRVEYRVIPDDDERVTAVISGEADAAEYLPLRRAAELSGRRGVRPLVRDGLRVMFLALRPHGRPFEDVRVREAVNLALDRKELLRRALAGFGVPATQLVPPAVSGFDPSIEQPETDLVRAKALLEKAGCPEGIDIELFGTNNRYVNDVEVLHEVSRQLAAVGVRAKVNALDKAVFFPLCSAGRTRLHLIGWSSESGDAGDALDALAHSKQESGLGSENDVDLADAELDRLIESANAAVVAEERLTRLQKAMRRLCALHIYLPLYVQPETAIVSTRIVWDPAPSLGFVAAEMRHV
jgi:peptide/nickel transport system substrate-binding protein